jgi:hypothetical protein
MYCPKCDAEYRPGFSECSDCHVALVDAEPHRDGIRMELRLEAAELLRQFADGEITNDQFVDGFYPLIHRANDRALRAVAVTFWGVYENLYEYTLTGRHELTPELRGLFDRCILFLHTALPYRWERLGSDVISRLAELQRRLLHGTPRDGLRTGPHTKQDWTVWPFDSEEELRTTRASIRKSN